jgi:DNA-binding CsgD family transcriptional regulator
MTRAESIHQAIRVLYQAALAPDDWPAAVGAIAATIRASRGMLVAQSTDGAGLAAATGLSAEDAWRMEREFETRVPAWIAAIPVGQVARQTSMITDADFRRTDIYREVVGPMGDFYGIIAPLTRTPDHRIHLVAGRSLGDADFTDEDASALRTLLPHIAITLEIRRRTEAVDVRVRAAYEALGQVNIGVILLDAWMRPIFINARAEALAVPGEGLRLSAQSVAALRADETRTLHAMVARAIAFNHRSRDASEAAIQHPPLRCQLSRPPPRPPLLVTIVPVHDPSLVGGASLATRAILLIVSPENPPGAEARNDLFHLTQRESQIAALLATGLSLTEAASQLDIGIGTARGYLKRVLAKTGTHRQGELVSLLLRGNAPNA